MDWRHEARISVLQFLYSTNLDFIQNKEQALEFIYYFKIPEQQQCLFIELVNGISTNYSELILLIEGQSKNWRLERLNSVDRIILLIGFFELRFLDSPKPIIINECVELAKKFGDKDSYKFINGILDS